MMDSQTISGLCSQFMAALDLEVPNAAEQDTLIRLLNGYFGCEEEMRSHSVARARFAFDTQPVILEQLRIRLVRHPRARALFEEITGIPSILEKNLSNGQRPT